MPKIAATQVGAVAIVDPMALDWALFTYLCNMNSGFGCGSSWVPHCRLAAASKPFIRPNLDFEAWCWLKFGIGPMLLKYREHGLRVAARGQ